MANCLVDNANCLVSVVDFVHHGFFVFQVFVNREEMLHFVKYVGRNLVDVCVLIVVRVLKGDSNGKQNISPSE